MLKTTSNFWQVPRLKSSPRKRNIKFRNGVLMELDLTGYRKVRDLFTALEEQKFKVRETEEGFVVIKSQPPFLCNVPSVETVSFFTFLLSLSQQSWAIKQTAASTIQADKNQSSFQIQALEDRLYLACSGNLSLTGPVESLMAYFLECENGVYEYDYRDKTVLDVGAFCGESAVYFARQGAKKIVIYEPIKKHHKLIQKNIETNKINAEVHQEGLAEKNGYQTMTYEDTGLGFGLLSKGSHTLVIAVKSAQDIIRDSGADVAKIDCEGAEINLLSVSPDVLGLIGFYIVETHTIAIQDSIRKKFLDCGFAEDRAAKRLEGEIYMVYFAKA
jgi:FkbM family methyltransferase